VAVPVPAASGPGVRAPVDLGPARRARAVVRVTTTDAHRGGTATRATVVRRHAGTATSFALLGAVRRSALGATLATTTAHRRAAPRPPATCSTVATPYWRPYGPVVRFAR
jgi:hypothetical protein